jgi:hypothetical protein
VTHEFSELLDKATTFARHWRDQDGVNAAVLDELADAVEAYLGRAPTINRPVTERELFAAKQQGQGALDGGADFLWITRLPDGRALFLLPWSGGGAQLSIGRLGEGFYHDTWNYHPGHADAAWRGVLAWDGRGEPEGWTRHPVTGRVRPDGTPASEGLER